MTVCFDLKRFDLKRSVAILLAMLIAHENTLAQDLPTERIVCEYPKPAERDPFPSLDPASLQTANEVEPNNTVTQAQAVPLGFATGQDIDVDITGKIGVFDNDIFSFSGVRGDVLGVAVLAIDSNELDSRVAVLDATGNVLVMNEDHQIGATKIGDLYPPESPLPVGGLRRDSMLSFVVPSDGVYHVRVVGAGASNGDYLCQLRLRKPQFTNELVGTRQIIFLDFDGATLNAEELFGNGGLPNATLSPFSSFLAALGLQAGDEGEMIDLISQAFEAHFTEAIATSGATGTASIDVRNSKDHPDPFGTTPFASRIVIGGKISELGIATIGIAECIDPGNFSANDTAVVLLDLLSSPSSNPNSIKSLPRAQGVTAKAAISRVVAAIAAHEAGHFLGCWHTENSNNLQAVMDRGGNLANSAGVDSNGTLDANDPITRFVEDLYANEGIGRTLDKQEVDARVIAALAIGTAPDTDDSTDLIASTLAAAENRLQSMEVENEPKVNAILQKLNLPLVIQGELPRKEIKLERMIEELRSKKNFLDR